MINPRQRDEAPAPVGEELDAVLCRPADERRREHKYRFAQGVVFGLPVVALEWFGQWLGGEESALWIAAFQAILAIWVVYVAATGMLIEAFLLRRLTMDALAAGCAVLLYLAGVLSLGQMLLDYPAWFPPLFHWSVLSLIAWTGWQWWRFSRTPSVE